MESTCKSLLKPDRSTPTAYMAIRPTMAIAPSTERAAARSGALTVIPANGAHHSPIAIAANNLVQ